MNLNDLDKAMDMLPIQPEAMTIDGIRLYYSEEQVEKIKSKFAQEIKEALEKYCAYHLNPDTKDTKNIFIPGDSWQAFWKERGL